MNKALRRPMTQEEFFTWEGHGEGRYEFDGFQPVAMNGGSINHYRIVRNVQRAVDSRLRNPDCEFLGAGAGVNTVGKAVRCPDGMVACANSVGTAFMVPGVVIVFEVVSPGSRRLDRVIKKREYAAVESIRRYVILESETAEGRDCARSDAQEPWAEGKLTLGGLLRLPEIGIEVPVSEFYEGVEFVDNPP